MKTIEMFCSHCESRIFETDRTCPQCGAPTRNYIKVEKEEGKAPKKYLVSVAQVFFRDINTLKILAEGIANIDSAFSFSYDFYDNKIYSYYHHQKMTVKTIMENRVLSNSNIKIGDYYNMVLIAKTIDKNNLQDMTYTQIEVPKLKILGMSMAPKDKYDTEEEWLDQSCVIDGIADPNEEDSYISDYYARVSYNLDKVPEFAKSYA